MNWIRTRSPLSLDAKPSDEIKTEKWKRKHEFLEIKSE